MMITVNGEPHPAAEGLTLRVLLQELNVDPAYVAVSVNREFAPRATYDACRLADGDEVEVLSPRQGG